MINLNEIVTQLESERDRINAAIAALKGMGGKTQATKGIAVVKPQRKMSAAGRKRIAAAQRARWAKIKAKKA